MQSSTERDNIEFGLPLACSFKQLVNNAHLADIRFKVGQCGELIYAHKLIIAMASEVFYTQFYRGFAESQCDTLTNPVAIDDIEPAPFLELLRYIYCREVNILPGNMLDLYYASEKYMLRKLGMMCENKFYLLINATTVLKVLQHNRRYEFPAVDTLCLEMIRDNPLKYFKQEEFLTLSQQALKLIVSSPVMNCNKDQLVLAIEQWEQCNEKTEIDVQLHKTFCRKLYFYNKCAYSSNIDTRFVLNPFQNKIIALHGMGIYVGVENDSPMPNSTVTVSVNLNGFNIKETFPVLDELKIYEIIFEKQLIDKQCEISVTVVQQGCEEQYEMFHLQGWYTMDETMVTVAGCAGTQHIGYRHSSYNYGSTSVINCVAYLLCVKTYVDKR
ncbi:uncharacterized protein LOC135697520 [Ochlerotatus camptorhynchus]|uniref:uncharacterized protein LOC135697520 n=1 Tax=Ochlerotatus camptorhynchus TaxID=644619 RepID=UPI0031E22F0A